MKFFIDDLPVCLTTRRTRHCLIHDALVSDNLPLRPNIPWLVESVLLTSALANKGAEQYAYMCDLKRTLDATVWVCAFGRGS